MATWILKADGIAEEAVRDTKARLSRRFNFNDEPLDGYGECSIKVVDERVVEISALLPDSPGSPHPIRPPQIRRLELSSLAGAALATLASEAAGLMSWADTYKAVVDSVRSGSAIAFVGAGLSCSLGYPSWAGLIGNLANEACIAIAEADSNARGERLLAIAGECRERLGDERYFEILERIFQENKGQAFAAHHASLMDMPFSSYITTNYDPCLEIAAERTHAAERLHTTMGTQDGFRVQTWPRFYTDGLHQRDVIHLHGKIPRGKDPRQILKTVRLTMADYREAYEERKEITELIGTALSNSHNFVFMGYSLGDPDLHRILNHAWKQRNESLDFASRYGLGGEAGSRHFAFLSSETIEQRRASAFESDYGIEVVDLGSGTTAHSQLLQLIDDLQIRTSSITFSRTRGTEPPPTG